MTKEDIKAALVSARPIKIVLSEEEETEVANFVFGDRTVGTDSKDAAIKLFQETLDSRLDRILEEVRLLLEQREEQLADLQQIAIELLKDKIIERMTPRLSLLQRQKLKSQALLWDIDLNCADAVGEFGMRVEKYAAREVLDAWRADYNEVRPHSALANRTPEEFRAHHLAVAARAENGQNCSPGLSS